MKDKFTWKSECFRENLKSRQVRKGNMGSE